MKIKKQLPTFCVLLLTLLLVACDCEDLNLGTITLKGNLNKYVPEATKGESLHIRFGDKVGTMGYQVTRDTFLVTVPVDETGKKRMHGKGAVSDCIEYYNAQNRMLDAYAQTQTLPLSISVLQTKNFNPGGYTGIEDSDEVADVLQFTLGYQTTFPQVVTQGMLNYYGYKALRTFTFSTDPAKLVYKPNDVRQEYHESITLDGVRHEKVYHLYLASPQLTEEEVYLQKHYPIPYVQGVYLKEGFGPIRVYTSTGQKFDISRM